MVLTILWQVYMFLLAYEPIQACQLMEELFGRVKQGFWMITGLNFKWKHEHKQWRRGKQSEENSCSLLSHFWSTSWSLFFAYYIPFECLGSQESNASNRVWFGAEMRKIWPSEDNCIMSNDQFRKVIASKVLSSWLRFVHVKHNPKLFLAFRVIGSQPKIIHIILNRELFIASRGLRSWDPESLISSTTLSYS